MHPYNINLPQAYTWFGGLVVLVVVVAGTVFIHPNCVNLLNGRLDAISTALSD
jgi:hypothetical protein